MIPLWYLIFIIPASACVGVLAMALVVSGRRKRRDVVLRRLYDSVDNLAGNPVTIMAEMSRDIKRANRGV